MFWREFLVRHSGNLFTATRSEAWAAEGERAGRGGLCMYALKWGLD